ncbi:MAG: hypothetical protein AAF682_04265 [Planctomycetota bacterium]
MKLRARCLALAALGGLLLPACVSTDLAAQCRPEYRDVRFVRVLVVADLGTLGARCAAEDRVTAELTHAHVDALRSLDVVFAADTLPFETCLDEAAEAGADAVLLLTTAGEGDETHYLSPGRSSTVTGEEDGRRTETTTTFWGARVTPTPWAEFEARLYETGSGVVAWYASAVTEGPSGSSRRELADSFAEAVAGQLLSDGLLTRRR